MSEFLHDKKWSSLNEKYWHVCNIIKESRYDYIRPRSSHNLVSFWRFPFQTSPYVDCICLWSRSQIDCRRTQVWRWSWSILHVDQKRGLWRVVTSHVIIYSAVFVDRTRRFLLYDLLTSTETESCPLFTSSDSTIEVIRSSCVTAWSTFNIDEPQVVRISRNLRSNGTTRAITLSFIFRRVFDLSNRGFQKS